MIEIFKTYKVGAINKLIPIRRYAVKAFGYESVGSMSGTNYSGFHEDIVTLPFRVDDCWPSNNDGLIYRQGNSLYVLGGNIKGNLGLGKDYRSYDDIFIPIKIFEGINIKKVEVYSSNTFILDKGTLYACSITPSGCFNDGLSQSHYTWDIVDTEVEDFSSSNGVVCYKKEDKLYHCGGGLYQTNIANSYTSQVILENAANVTMLKMIGNGNCLIASTNDENYAYIWGRNEYNRFSSSSTSTVYNGEYLDYFPSPIKIFFEGYFGSNDYYGLFYIDKNDSLYGRGHLDKLFPNASSWTLLKENCSSAYLNFGFCSTALNGEGNITTKNSNLIGLSVGDNLIFTKDKIGDGKVSKVVTYYTTVDGNRYPYSFCLVDDEVELNNPS